MRRARRLRKKRDYFEQMWATFSESCNFGDKIVACVFSHRHMQLSEKVAHIEAALSPVYLA